MEHARAGAAPTDSTFIDTPSGQLIAARHIVALDIQESGVQEEQRHAVQATLVTGDKQTLRVFQGGGSGAQAMDFLTDLLAQLGARRIGGPGQ